MLKHLSTGFNSRDAIKLGNSAEPFCSCCTYMEGENEKKEEKKRASPRRKTVQAFQDDPERLQRAALQSKLIHQQR